MKRNIIHIDEEKCTGCGLCASTCHEGAIEMIGGKAKLVSESYCDGLGACLPACPVDAIHLEERDADAFDEEAVKVRMQAQATPAHAAPKQTAHEHACHGGEHEHHHGCPGTRMRQFNREEPAPAVSAPVPASAISTLRQWPVQIKLAPINAPYFGNAHLLIAADCTAYAHANFNQTFMRGKVTLIGCPKLDEGDYSKKLTEILARNDIQSVTVARMEVPCCGGIVSAVKTALLGSGKMIPWSIVTIGTDGTVLEN